MVVAQDATENARKRMRLLLIEPDIAVVTCGSRNSLGRAVGRAEAVVVGIRDRGLSAKIVGEAEATGR